MNQLNRLVRRSPKTSGIAKAFAFAMDTLRFSSARGSGLGTTEDAARADDGGSNAAVDSFTQQLQAKTEAELAELLQQRGRPNAAAAAAAPAEAAPGEGTEEVDGPKGLEPTRYGAPPPPPPPLCCALPPEPLGGYITGGRVVTVAGDWERGGRCSDF